MNGTEKGDISPPPPYMSDIKPAVDEVDNNKSKINPAYTSDDDTNKKSDSDESGPKSINGAYGPRSLTGGTRV